MSNKEKIEPMLVEDNQRFTLFPIKRHDLWKAYKDHEDAFWTAEELEYLSDKNEWNALSNDEKYFIEHILAFFAGADGIVMENLMSNFVSEVKWPEAKCFYGAQNYIEQVHSQVYSVLIDTYIDDPVRKTSLFNAIDEIPCVKLKAEWAKKWMDPATASFAERLVAFAVVEGVFFSGSFCAIFWLKSRKKMVSCLGKSNELIARDESLHANFAVLLFKYLENKPSQEVVHKIFREAVEIETNFIVSSIPCKMIGMNSDLMAQYIKFVADYWLMRFGYTTIYNEKNPFPFMDMLNVDGKSNFFEQRVTEYRRANRNNETMNKLSGMANTKTDSMKDTDYEEFENF